MFYVTVGSETRQHPDFEAALRDVLIRGYSADFTFSRKYPADVEGRDY